MMMKMQFPDVATYELAQRLARELGMTVTLLQGPKDEALEGLRIVSVTPQNPMDPSAGQKYEMMQDAFAAHLVLMTNERQSNVQALTRLAMISPDWA